MKMVTMHYISEEDTGNRFIIAKTKCGKHWQSIVEFTTKKEEVTCKVCLKNLKK